MAHHLWPDHIKNELATLETWRAKQIQQLQRPLFSRWRTNLKQLKTGRVYRGKALTIWDTAVKLHRPFTITEMEQLLPNLTWVRQIIYGFIRAGSMTPVSIKARKVYKKRGPRYAITIQVVKRDMTDELNEIERIYQTSKNRIERKNSLFHNLTDTALKHLVGLNRPLSKYEKRTKAILIARQEGHTLEELGQQYGLSRERIRQIQMQAFKNC